MVQAALLLSRDRQLAGRRVRSDACTACLNNSLGCRDPANGSACSFDRKPCCTQDGTNILSGTEDDPFIRGIRIWLRAHQYNTSTTDQLWAAMSSAVGRNVGAWMKGWSYQEGFPLVRVTLGGITGREVSVSQVWASSLGHCWARLAQLGALVAALNPHALHCSSRSVGLSMCPVKAAQ